MSASAGSFLALVGRSIYFVRATCELLPCGSCVGEPFQSTFYVLDGTSRTLVVTITSLKHRRFVLWFPRWFVEPYLWVVCVTLFMRISRIPVMLAIAVASRASRIRSMSGFFTRFWHTVGCIHGSIPVTIIFPRSFREHMPVLEDLLPKSTGAIELVSPFGP